MTIDTDLEAIYADDAIACDLRRNEDAGTFRGIVSEADQEALQGYVVGAATELRWITAAVTLQEGDTVTDGVRTWRVARDGRRVLDGKESLTYLTETTV
jgi:hypothetical protein